MKLQVCQFCLVLMLLSAADCVLKRFYKIECQSSGKTIKIDTCNVKAYSRNLTVVNIGVETLRGADVIYLDYGLYYKYSINWRQIIRLPKIEVCSVMNQAKQFAGIEGLIMVFLNTTKTAVPKCPIAKGLKIVVTNYTEAPSMYDFVPMPGGDYKVIIKLYDDVDDLILKMSIQYIMKTDGKYEF